MWTVWKIQESMKKKKAVFFAWPQSPALHRHISWLKMAARASQPRALSSEKGALCCCLVGKRESLSGKTGVLLGWLLGSCLRGLWKTHIRQQVQPGAGLIDYGFPCEAVLNYKCILELCGDGCWCSRCFSQTLILFALSWRSRTESSLDRVWDNVNGCSLSMLKIGRV